MDLLAWIRECADVNLDGVELLGGHFAGTDHDYLVRLKKTCSDLYLTIAMVSADGHLTVADDDKRAEEVEAIGKWVDVAAFLGAPRVRFFCGSGEELEAGGPALYEKVLSALRQIAETAARHGIIMALENHGGTTADQLLSLHADVKSDFLKLALDTGNFPPTSRVGPETYASIERCAPHATIVHAKFFNVEPDGRDRDFDWHRIHSLLAKSGFRGFLSIEYEGDDPDEPAAVRRIARFLRTL